MIYEIDGILVAATKAKRDAGYNWLLSKAENLMPDDGLEKLDLWAGQPFPEGWKTGDTLPQGQWTYSVRVVMRFKTQAALNTAKAYFNSTIKPNTIAGILYGHNCCHDEGKPCEPRTMIMQWADAALTAAQKNYLKEAYEELG